MFCEIFLQFHEIKTYFVKISRNTTFCQNDFEFRKIRGKFCENENKNFVNISWNYKTKFRSNPMQELSEGGGGGPVQCTAVEYSPGAFMWCTADRAVIQTGEMRLNLWERGGSFHRESTIEWHCTVPSRLSSLGYNRYSCLGKSADATLRFITLEINYSICRGSFQVCVDGGWVIVLN